MSPELWEVLLFMFFLVFSETDFSFEKLNFLNAGKFSMSPIHISDVAKFFVNCIDGFKQQPEVANGVSDLMVEVFGEAGRHARFAVGTNALPRNCATESDAVFEIFSN